MPARCPTCRNALTDDPSQSRYRPFCSERCQLVDLGRWLDGSYAIPTDEQAEPVPDGQRDGNNA